MSVKEAVLVKPVSVNNMCAARRNHSMASMALEAAAVEANESAGEKRISDSIGSSRRIRGGVEIEHAGRDRRRRGGS